MITLLGIAVNVCGLIMVLVNMIFLIGLCLELRRHNLEWVYLVSRDGKKVSTSKVLQLIGGFTGTWIVINMTLGGTLTWHMLMVYLGYVASVEGFSRMLPSFGRK